MRVLMAAAALALLSACAAGGTSRLMAADGATALIVGQNLTMTRVATGATGNDPLVILTLAHEDGRRMRFEEANHAPQHLWAQAPGGPLSQVMGLFGDETPTLYVARDNLGAPFFCPTEGPVAIGVYETPDGAVRIVGLRQQFQFDERPDGTHDAAPYSPDQVCARLNLRRL